MRILFLGDIVGRPGRKTVKTILPEIMAEKSPDFVLANAENLAGGKGINRKTVLEMMEAGIDAFTGGNHSFDNDGGFEIYEKGDLPVLRPLNFPEGTPGKGFSIITSKTGKKLLLISLQGRVFMPQQLSCPFRAVESLLKTVKPSDYDASLIDIHAETTGEKQAIRWHFDGQVSAIIGTHSHVPTLDAEVSKKGTAYQTDAGMNGSLDSCIGVKKEIIIHRLKNQMPMVQKLEDTGRMQFNATLMNLDDQGKATKIETIRKII